MRLSTNRILTTHVGSLPRPEDLVELLRREDRGEPVDAAALQARAKQAVAQCVAEQIEAGLDVVNDGEMSKMSYHVYLKHRLSGLSNIEGFGVRLSASARYPGPSRDDPGTARRRWHRSA